jgi:two-component system sensor histidine kinase HupT/HoxJ
MLVSSKPDGKTERRLIQRAGVASTLDLNHVSEEAWIEVVQKMDAVYAELRASPGRARAQNAALRRRSSSSAASWPR